MTEINVQTEKIVSEFLQLSPDKQAAVAEFIRRLNDDDTRRSEPTSFLAAVDEFMDTHPELLKRLAQ